MDDDIHTGPADLSTHYCIQLGDDLLEARPGIHYPLSQSYNTIGQAVMAHQEVSAGGAAFAVLSVGVQWFVANAPGPSLVLAQGWLGGGHRVAWVRDIESALNTGGVPLVGDDIPIVHGALKPC